jgi:hypothetical protein
MPVLLAANLGFPLNLAGLCNGDVAPFLAFAAPHRQPQQQQLEKVLGPVSGVSQPV